MTTRLVAIYPIDLGPQPGPDFNPEAVVYESRLVKSKAEAEDVVRIRSFDGEGHLHTQQLFKGQGWSDWEDSEDPEEIFTDQGKRRRAV